MSIAYRMIKYGEHVVVSWASAFNPSVISPYQRLYRISDKVYGIVTWGDTPGGHTTTKKFRPQVKQLRPTWVLYESSPPPSPPFLSLLPSRFRFRRFRRPGVLFVLCLQVIGHFRLGNISLAGARLSLVSGFLHLLFVEWRLLGLWGHSSSLDFQCGLPDADNLDLARAVVFAAEGTHGVGESLGTGAVGQHTTQRRTQSNALARMWNICFRASRPAVPTDSCFSSKATAGDDVLGGLT